MDLQFIKQEEPVEYYLTSSASDEELNFTVDAYSNDKNLATFPVPVNQERSDDDELAKHVDFINRNSSNNQAELGHGDNQKENVIRENMNVSRRTFLKLGNTYTASSMSRSTPIALRRFKSFFGVTPLVCAIIWDKLRDDLPAGAEPKHLLWTLLFLKQYSNERERRSILRADEKSVRKWTWTFVELLSNMNVIIWENRFDLSSVDQTSFCSLDGIDFKIIEPKPSNQLWHSHKFRGPGLRYEIALNIRSGHIVWAYGGCPCGEYSDLKLAQELYLLSVVNGEKTVATRGYKDDTFFVLPNSQNKNLHKQIMTRHEGVNKQLRYFQILKQTFRSDLSKHPMVFKAVANITQIIIENGDESHYLVNSKLSKINRNKK